jgi:hypothetical protein
MKAKPRPTKSRVIARRITAPETKTDPASGKRIALLSYIDAGSYQQHAPTTKDIFLYAAGSNEEGEVQNGMDRLLHHRFVVHLDAGGKAIGLDVIPDRLYRSGVTPTSQVDVKTLVIEYLMDGAVARVTQRPFNVRFEQSFAVIQELDKLIASGKPITTSMRLGELALVVGVTDNTVEVKLNASRRRIQGEAIDDMEDVQEESESLSDSADDVS